MGERVITLALVPVKAGAITAPSACPQFLNRIRLVNSVQTWNRTTLDYREYLCSLRLAFLRSCSFSDRSMGFRVRVPIPITTEPTLIALAVLYGSKAGG
jgi:hypothetical protein